MYLPETLAAATPAQAAGVGAGLSWGLGWGLDVGRLPFSHLHSTHTAGLQHKHRETEEEREGEGKEEAPVRTRRSSRCFFGREMEGHVVSSECELRMQRGGASGEGGSPPAGGAPPSGWEPSPLPLASSDTHGPCISIGAVSRTHTLTRTHRHTQRNRHKTVDILMRLAQIKQNNCDSKYDCAHEREKKQRKKNKTLLYDYFLTHQTPEQTPFFFQKSPLFLDHEQHVLQRPERQQRREGGETAASRGSVQPGHVPSEVGNSLSAG